MQKLKNKINIAVWLVMIIMLIPAFFILPQKSQEASPDSKVKSLTKSKENYYTNIPSRAVTLTSVVAYKDAAMTQKVGEIPRQNQLEIINLKENVFELSNHTFIKADPTMIGSDVLLSKEEQKIAVYTASSTEFIIARLRHMTRKFTQNFLEVRSFLQIRLPRPTGELIMRLTLTVDKQDGLAKIT
jgi:hypothetical protein